jgi:phytoene dehydrogenase-like protein
VIALERRDEAGGGLTTDENPRHPGFLHNTHAFFHRALTDMPWYRDLELARHGARYIEPELNVALILPDGRSLQWWTDFERTAASFARFSERDAATLRRWHDESVSRRRSLPRPCTGPLPVRLVLSSGRQHHGPARLQRRPGRARRSRPHSHLGPADAGGVPCSIAVRRHRKPGLTQINRACGGAI